MPPASSGHRARDPLGWSTSRPPTTMAHTGPNQLLPWPWHPCYSQARPILSLTMTESTKKRSRATDLRCPPAAVGRGHRVMLGACGQPTAQATQTCHQRTRQRRGLAPPRVRHSSGASWLAGGSEDGKRNGEEKTTHNLRDTHTGPSFPEVGVRCGLPVSAEMQLYNPAARNTARPCSGHVACHCTRLGAAGLSVIALHVPSHRQLVLSP